VTGDWIDKEERECGQVPCEDLAELPRDIAWIDVGTSAVFVDKVVQTLCLDVVQAVVDLPENLRRLLQTAAPQ
jgi:hypothetical protein